MIRINVYFQGRFRCTSNLAESESRSTISTGASFDMGLLYLQLLRFFTPA